MRASVGVQETQVKGRIWLSGNDRAFEAADVAGRRWEDVKAMWYAAVYGAFLMHYLGDVGREHLRAFCNDYLAQERPASVDPLGLLEVVPGTSVREIVVNGRVNAAVLVRTAVREVLGRRV